MSIDTSNGHPAMDYRAHRDTYAGFVRFAQVSIGVMVLLLIFMAIFLL